MKWAYCRPLHILPAGRSLFASGSMQTAKNQFHMPSPNKKLVKSYLTPEEYRQVNESATKAGLSVSTFIRRVCLGHKVSSTVDHQAVLALAKANADLGRLGGLFKMFLSEGKAGQHADELRVTLWKIEESKDKVARQFNELIKAFTHKKSRKPGI